MLKFFSKRRGEKGFTLIELLVVIAIIGILATIVLVSLNNARKKARDARRLGDIRQIALALEMYADDNNAKYPADASAGSGCDAWTTMATALETDYMTSVPDDPINDLTHKYQYETNSDALKYVLVAPLEDTNNSALDNDVDGTVYTNCDCGDAATDDTYCIQP